MASISPWKSVSVFSKALALSFREAAFSYLGWPLVLRESEVVDALDCLRDDDMWKFDDRHLFGRYRVTGLSAIRGAGCWYVTYNFFDMRITVQE